MYWIELAGETDAFAAREAATAATGVELLAPGIASAGSVGLSRRDATDRGAIRRQAALFALELLSPSKDAARPG